MVWRKTVKVTCFYHKLFFLNFKNVLWLREIVFYSQGKNKCEILFKKNTTHWWIPPPSETLITE